ncbi:PVC-type heme-binding CxxCH protein [Thalassoglobus sp.]|uniref:PVC-type heme-binding CxxCH protein n=1 Tax=Thalassoglobus sp. TaxID=2795869 RepID=UPI003AA9C5C8
MPRFLVHTLFLYFLLSVLSAPCFAQRLEIPRRHEKPPGPPLSAEEAVKKMVVPEGFSVELVAHEPDVMNPVGMAIDEKGRFWVTESFEYPRRSPGPGRDRIKVLEDTTGDGMVDKVTVFAEGLNIPSGIAVGHGGVWVANAPDLLFMQDTDGDLKADKIETVLTGFGRTDTHELPNSLTWGPDGWLYGLNGVFNYCHVYYSKENPNYEADHPGFKFTCAMFRIHPRTREFQIFAEGTSNPWGIAFNGDGEAFISACVIDHLWHISESAYYIRQGGPYPPHTWPMGSIVDHKHQKAAYCGITWFDSEAYPEEYRNVLYMGNIHGGCINADIADRSGATYKGRPHPGFPAPQGAFEHDTVRKIGEGDDAKLADFLTANDAWFMPVVQKVGPDGCLYILDWYDRYHCYQDANADPEGVDRSKGRLYRVVYQGHENKKAEDLGAKSDDELITLLGDSNVYKRNTAQRLLQERMTFDLAKQVLAVVKDEKTSHTQRMHALFCVVYSEDFTKLYGEMRSMSTSVKDEIEPWLVRRTFDDAEFSKLAPQQMKKDQNLDQTFKKYSPQMLAQMIIGASKFQGEEEFAVKYLLAILRVSGNDPMLRHLVWQNLLPLIDDQPDAVIDGLRESLNGAKEDYASGIGPICERAVPVLCENRSLSGKTLGGLFEAVLKSPNSTPAFKSNTLALLSRLLREGQLSKDQRAELYQTLKPVQFDNPNLTVVLALLGDVEAMQVVRKTFNDRSKPQPERLEALRVLVAARAPRIVSNLGDAIGGLKTAKSFRIAAIEAVGGVNDPELAGFLLDNYPTWEADVQPRVIEVLTQRDTWSVALLKEIEAKKIDKEAVNLNQLKRVSSFKNDELQKLVAKVYGQIRTDRRSDRQHVINFHRDFLNGTPGDPHKGIAVFKKVCAQCHKMYGEGAEVGPDITRNGRSNWNQLLQNVFDPSAVIGPGYQARLLATEDGRILTGLPVEESDERVVLKIQGGKIETIPRDKIEAYKISEVSMMPEDLEKQLKPQELADLFAFLALDRPPNDPNAKILSGAPKQKIRD